MKTKYTTNQILLAKIIYDFLLKEFGLRKDFTSTQLDEYAYVNNTYPPWWGKYRELSEKEKNTFYIKDILLDLEWVEYTGGGSYGEMDTRTYCLLPIDDIDVLTKII